jgi:hypothetical protein
MLRSALVISGHGKGQRAGDDQKPGERDNRDKSWRNSVQRPSLARLANKICTDYPETPKTTVAGSVLEPGGSFPTEITNQAAAYSHPSMRGSSEQAATPGQVSR